MAKNHNTQKKAGPNVYSISKNPPASASLLSWARRTVRGQLSNLPAHRFITYLVNFPKPVINVYSCSIIMVVNSKTVFAHLLPYTLVTNSLKLVNNSGSSTVKPTSPIIKLFHLPTLPKPPRWLYNKGRENYLNNHLQPQETALFHLHPHEDYLVRFQCLVVGSDAAHATAVIEESPVVYGLSCNTRLMLSESEQSAAFTLTLWE